MEEKENLYFSIVREGLGTLVFCGGSLFNSNTGAVCPPLPIENNNTALAVRQLGVRGDSLTLSWNGKARGTRFGAC